MGGVAALEPVTQFLLAQKAVHASKLILSKGVTTIPRMLPFEARLGRVLVHRVVVPFLWAPNSIGSAWAPKGAHWAPKGAHRKGTHKWKKSLKKFGRVKVVVRKYVHWILFAFNIVVARTVSADYGEDVMQTPIGLLVIHDILKDIIDNQCQ